MHNPFIRFFLCAGLLSALTVGSAQITTPYLYDNVFNNFSGNGQPANAYRGTLGVKSHRFSNPSSINGNDFYKINNQSNNNDNDFNAPSGSKVWSGTLSVNTLGTAFLYGDGNAGAGSLPVTSGKYYNFIWQDVNTSTDALAIMMITDNSPVTITSTTSMPASPGPTTPVTVTVQLSSTPSSQENVFLRYSTNNFSTYGTLLNPTSGAGTSTQTFTIPAQPNNTNVKYYILTSTLANGSLAGQSSLTDMATLNFDNNGGANYGYVSLPIELTEFHAVKAGHTVNLQWTTATEQNNDRFEVERSANGADWTILTVVPTKNGNARYPQNYQTTDVNPQPARNYYRLRQVDTDGRTSYSAVRIVEMGVGSIASVAPNPIENGLLQLTLTGSPSPNQVRLTDSQGRLLRSWTLEMETSGTVPLDLSEFPKGVMFLQVNAEPAIRLVKI